MFIPIELHTVPISKQSEGSSILVNADKIFSMHRDEDSTTIRSEGGETETVQEDISKIILAATKMQAMIMGQKDLKISENS